ncbi:DNA polymerase eta, putative [Bodo saltans]|uniref:DNA polymerase eta n=1 Tax=Bodo saltans TaxID=75058 RepID=A0A0S4J2C8_BODSA|nr:DNA polymerase eta, putative [Bodo saltans]|eukprot:CUG54578.1 DNA polymerase eta, putative [Bodo saltans]
MCAHVICHIDLDCFYAQVEALRLGIDFRNEPYVLVQWGNLIAVNYPARKAGIGRFETIRDAIAKCPEIKYSGVPTFEVGSTEYQYHSNPNKGTHKVSLDPYRRASKKIFDVFGSFPGVQVEKGGVDEAYLDVTEAAHSYVESFYQEHGHHITQQDIDAYTRMCPNRDEDLHQFLQLQEAGGVVPHIETFAPAPTPEYHRLLLAGCAVVKTIRDKVRTELGYDCSAGVSHNRMLSKCISALFKPNQQTLLYPEGTLGFLFDFKFSKLRMFGGKLGQTIEQGLHGTTCGDLWQYSEEAIAAVVGDKETGAYIYRRVRGFDADTVAARTMAKSLLAQKVFSPLTDDVSVLRKWFVVLAQELVERLQEFGDMFGVCGRNMNVKLGGSGLQDSSDVGNKSFPLPTPTTAEALTGVAVRYASIVINNAPGRVQINSVSMSISDFRKMQQNEDVLAANQQTLDRFFKKRPRDDSATSKKEYDTTPRTTETPEKPSRRGEKENEQDEDGDDVVIIEPALSEGLKTPIPPATAGRKKQPRPHDAEVIELD